MLFIVANFIAQSPALFAMSPGHASLSEIPSSNSIGRQVDQNTYSCSEYRIRGYFDARSVLRMNEHSRIRVAIDTAQLKMLFLHFQQMARNRTRNYADH